MFKNYIITAWRNLAKNKIFSAINIAGLSIGMAACLLILQYVSFQLSFDQFNSHAADLYRVANDRYQNGKLIQHGTITYSAIGKAMQDDFPEVVNHVRVRPQGPSIITWDAKKIGNVSGLAADNSFLDMFSYPLLAGDRATALREPNTVIITAELANKIFGASDQQWASQLGKMLVIGTSAPFKITGICRDAPENSHLTFSYIISYNTFYAGPYAWKQADYDFTDSDFWHYIQLKHGTDYHALEAKLPAFSQRHFQGSKISGSEEKFFLQPLAKAHLYSDFEYEIGQTASATVVWGLLLIAALIILIAWFNYINLATAKSLERAREVGIRKVSGATRPQLMRQFLTESTIINILALALALLLVMLLQSSFNALVGHQLSLSYLFHKGLGGYNISIALIALIISGIAVSGFYPALVLSSFKPILVLKGKFSRSTKGIGFQKALVVGQFAITVALIIGSLVVYRQIRFVSQQDLGIDLSQVLIIKPPQLTNWDSSFIRKENTLQAEIQKIPHVLSVANSWNVAGDEMGRDFDLRKSGEPDNVHYTTRKMGVSADFLDVYSIKLLAGRRFAVTDYNPEYKKLHNIIVNESVATLLGYRKATDIVGQTIHLQGREWDVIAVVNDFHQKSLRYAMEPMVLLPAYSTYSPLSIKLDTHELSGTIAAIREQYDAFFPGNLFDHYFLDEKFNASYNNDLLFGKVFAIFAAFAIFIACLGLLGLSLFATTQRRKEIGVRKVLGASVSTIVMLLSADFVKLIALAFLIACPVAWWVMHQWLQGFAYRIGIGWWMFALAGILALFIALATISYQAIRAALANPVKSLRTE